MATMPVLLVSDTSVIIDLERGGLLDAIFRLSYEFAVPDLLYERELKASNGEGLKSKGLQVLSLDAAGVQLAQDYRAREAKLSLPDTFALALAKTGNHVLLAGDGSLRDLAGAESVEVHGVLWLLDQLEAQGVLNKRDLDAALTKIASHRRCRLPKSEINKRLERYRAADEE
jgi:hypothetical protein